MNEFINTSGFALSITGPIIVVLALGVWLKRVGLITDSFIDVGSRLVFNVTLPALLFVTISRTDFVHTANIKLIAAGLVGSLIVYFLMELVAQRYVTPARDRGVVVQGAFRSNMAILGLAYCANAYGDTGFAVASLYMGAVTMLFNILAVITLGRSLHQQRSVRKHAAQIIKNPLIIAILLALPFSYFNVHIPAVVLRVGDYFGQMTLPLALLCTGGSLSLTAMRFERHNALIATAGKLILVPITLTGLGWFIGLQPMALGIVFLMSSTPTAAASYVMANAMGGNAPLAANIIALTTVGSIVVTSVGVAILRGQGLI